MSGQVEARVRPGAMLWFDDSKFSIAEKVERARAFYEQKYGKKATRCRVHPTTLAGETCPDYVGAVRMLIDVRVLPQHLWIGAD